MKEQKSSKRPLITYIIIALLVLFALEVFVFPLFSQQRTVTVSYSEFLQMLDDGAVERADVNRSTAEITFEATQSPEGQTLRTPVVYTTTAMDDPELTQRLLDHDVDFGASVVQQSNTLADMFIWVILPVVLMALLGWLLMRWMQKRMGGGAGALSFGKSNAKIYVEA